MWQPWIVFYPRCLLGAPWDFRLEITSTVTCVLSDTYQLQGWEGPWKCDKSLTYEKSRLDGTYLWQRHQRSLRNDKASACALLWNDWNVVMRISCTALKAGQVKLALYATVVSSIWEESGVTGTREPDRGETKETDKGKKLNGTGGGTTDRDAIQLCIDDAPGLEIIWNVVISSVPEKVWKKQTIYHSKDDFKKQGKDTFDDHEFTTQLNKKTASLLDFLYTAQWNSSCHK